MGNFRGANIVVTAATSGVGRACVEALASEGANIYFGSRGLERVSELVEDLRNKYPEQKIAGVSVDLSDDVDVQNFWSRAGLFFEETPAILIANQPGPPPLAWSNYSVGDLRPIFDEFFFPFVDLVIKACNDMNATGKSSRIVLISSLSSLRRLPSMGYSNLIRTALRGLVRDLGNSYAGSDFSINGLALAAVLTERAKSFVPHSGDLVTQADIDKVADTLPRGRFMMPCEVARYALNLCNLDRQYMTGEMLDLGGGISEHY